MLIEIIDIIMSIISKGKVLFYRKSLCTPRVPIFFLSFLHSNVIKYTLNIHIKNIYIGKER